MAEKIEFVRNVQDLSTDKGFQFEFACDRCGSGYRSQFKASLLGGVADALSTASGIFGGILGRAADVGRQVRDAKWHQARDAAYAEAVKELTPSFIQCPRCMAWVCRSNCWNSKRGLCKNCAPDLGVEMSAAQAERSVEEIYRHAQMAEEDKHLGAQTWKQTIRASCPRCEHPLETDAKFCPNCGEKLVAEAKCAKCGAKLAPNAKFCAQCGQKV